jgi:hypothetical protein
MKRLFTIAILSNTAYSFAQGNTATHNISKTIIPHSQNKTAHKDTVRDSDTSKKENKEPRYFYLSANAEVFVNTRRGAAKEKGNNK